MLSACDGYANNMILEQKWKFYHIPQKRSKDLLIVGRPEWVDNRFETDWLQPISG